MFIKIINFIIINNLTCALLYTSYIKNKMKCEKGEGCEWIVCPRDKSCRRAAKRAVVCGNNYN